MNLDSSVKYCCPCPFNIWIATCGSCRSSEDFADSFLQVIVAQFLGYFFLDFAPFLTLTCNCSSFSLNTRGYRELLLVFFGGFLRDFTCFKVVSLLHRIYFPGLLFSLGDALDLPSWWVLLCLPRWKMIRHHASRWLGQGFPILYDWVPRSGKWQCYHSC